MFNSFKLVTEDSNYSPFIKRIKVWSDDNNRRIIAGCYFDKTRYQPASERDFSLMLPACIKKSVAKRQCEFLAGRIAAQYAIAQLTNRTRDNVPEIGIGKHRMPIWPEHISGSISHSSDTAVAIVGYKHLNEMMGIDIEDMVSVCVAAEIGQRVHSPAELQLLRPAGLTSATATTLLFSAKESLFKGLFPIHNEYFDFHDVKLKRFVAEKNELQFTVNEQWSSSRGNQRYSVVFTLESAVLACLLNTN